METQAWVTVSKIVKEETYVDIDIQSKGRTSQYTSMVKAIAYNILVDIYGLSHRSISDYSGVDRSTVSFHIRKHSDKYSSSFKYKSVYDKIINIVSNSSEKPEQFKIADKLISNL